jgi:predicted Fe-Mo cluster-binding NifX family protein
MNIGITHWQGRVSPVFDVSEELAVIETRDGKVISRKFFRLASQRPYPRAKEISDIGIDVLICGAVSTVFQIALIGKKIRFLAFVCGDIDAVLHSFLMDRLTQSQFHMPGSGKKRRYRKMASAE